MDYVQAEIKFVQWMKVKGLAKNTIKNYESKNITISRLPIKRD